MPDYKHRLKELQTKPLKKGEVIVVCHHCTYPWVCTSELEYVSCPSCGGKTLRVKEQPQKGKPSS